MSSLASRCVKVCLLSVAVIAVVITAFLGVYNSYLWLTSANAVHKIAYVNYNDRTDVDRGFENYLRTRGIKYQIKYYSAYRDQKRLDQIKRELSADKNDLIITWGTTVTLGVFGTIDAPSLVSDPGVFVLVTSPVASKIVLSNEDPGRSITGSWHVAPVSNQLRSMMSYKRSQKIGILFTPSEQNSLIMVKDMTRQAAMIGIEVLAIPFDFRDGIPVSANTTAALQELKDRGCDWLYLPPDSFLGSQAKNLVIPEAHRLGLLTFASTEQLMKSGAAVGLIAPYAALGELTGEKAEQILIHRKKPSAIPVTTVARFEHVMNPDVAGKLGIDIMNPLFSDVTRMTL